MSLQNVQAGASFPVSFTAANYSTTTGRFTKQLGRNLDLSGFQCAVVQLSMYNSTQNIRAEYGNNRISVRFPAYFTKNPITGVSITPQNYWDLDIVIPDGWYILENLQAYIVNCMYLAGLYVPTTDGTSWSCFFQFDANPTTYGTRLQLPLVQAGAGYTLPPNPAWAFLTGSDIRNITFTIPSGSKFGNLIGFATGVYGGSAASQAIASTTCPVINVVSAFQFCINCVNNPFTNPSNLFYTLPISGANGDIMIPEINPVYNPCSGGPTSYLEIYLLDQDGAQYQPFDSEFTMTVNFLKVR